MPSTASAPESSWRSSRPLAVPFAQERMAREIDVQRHFRHLHIMPILDAASDCSWFVMPLAQGNLDELWSKGVLGSNAEPVLRGFSMR